MSSQETIPICELRLSPARLDALLNKLDTEASASGNESKRQFERVAHRARINVTAIFGGRSPDIVMSCVLRNLSRNGVAFIAGMVVAPGTRVIVEIPSKKNLGSLKRSAVVRRCRLVSGRIHEIGAEIIPDDGNKN